MKKSDLATEVAKRRGMERSTAADQLDSAVTEVIRMLRRGQPARLPGLGTIAPSASGKQGGKPWTFLPENVEKHEP